MIFVGKLKSLHGGSTFLCSLSIQEKGVAKIVIAVSVFLLIIHLCKYIKETFKRD